MKMNNEPKECRQPRITISKNDNSYNLARKRLLCFGASCVFQHYNKLGQIIITDIVTVIFIEDFGNDELIDKHGLYKMSGTKDKIKMIARAISHEFIHSLLSQEHGADANHRWDNISNDIKLCWYHHGSEL